MPETNLLPNDAPDTDGENGEQPAENEPARTYTDADVNRMKLNWQKDLLKQLGAGEDIKTAKDGMKRYQEWLDGQKSALEKAQGDVSTLTQTLSTEQAKSLRLERQLAALGKGVPADRADAYVRLADGYLGEDGDYDKALDAALKDFPLAATQQAEKRGSAGAGANPPPGSGGQQTPPLGALLAQQQKDRYRKYQKKGE